MTAVRKHSDLVQDIFLTQLVRSRFEPRKTIDAAALAELTDSIRLNGVLEPLIVRPLPAPEDVAETANADLVFEIGAGQRRWEASKAAGKTTAPCIVREMTDEQFRELAIISNLQRQDLEPLDEAEAYAKLLELPGATIETVAAKVGMAPGYVGRRLKLLDAIEPVRDALKAGAIEVGHALELARLDEARQRQMLSRMQVGVTLVEPQDVVDDDGEEGTCRFCGCTEEDACPGGCSWANEDQTVCDNPDCLEQFRAETGQQKEEWRKTHYSVIELKREIAESSHVDLANAPFPLIATLDPVPCTDCPKRAGNAQLLFDDCAQDTCTDRACFHRKVNQWITAELDAAKQEKRKLLKLTEGWTSDKDKVYCSEYHGARVIAAAQECPHAEDGIFVDGAKAGRRTFICRNDKCGTHHGKSSSGRSSSNSRATSPQQSEKQKADRKKVLDQVRAETAYRKALATGIAAKIPMGSDLAALVSDVCASLVGHMSSLYSGKLAAALGWDDEVFAYNGEKLRRETIGALPAGQQLVIALLSNVAGELSVQEYSLHSKPDGLEKLARRVGIDPVKLRAGLPSAADRKADKEPPEKSAPAPAAKKASAKKVKPKKRLLSAAARKRIAAAQKKRWATATKKAAKKAGKR